MTKLSKMRRNIKLNYLFTGCLNFHLASGFWVVYMVSKGFSLGQVGVAEAVYHIAALALEIPTGMFADLFGRKMSRISGCCIKLTSTLLMIYAKTFSGFCLAFVLTALGNALESGAGDAMVYDSLKLIGLAETYQKVAGKTVFIINVSQAAAMALAGILADLRFIYVYFGAACIEMITVLVSFFFTEPDLKGVGDGSRRKSSTSMRAHFKEQIRASFRIIRYNPRILNIILLVGILDTSASLIFFYGRRFFELLKMSEGNTGVIYTLYLLSGATAAGCIHKTERKFGEKRTISILLYLAITGFVVFACGTRSAAIGAFLLLGVVTGASFPLFSDYINKEVPSPHRATVLSVNAACFSMLMMVLFPLVGWLADLNGLQYAFKVIAFPVGALLIWMFQVCSKPEALMKR